MVRTILAFAAVIIAGFYLQAYWMTRERYNEIPELNWKLKAAHEQLEQERFRLALQEEQFESYRTEVASVLPNSGRALTLKSRDYPIRNLASVTRKGRSEDISKVVASTLFSTGKLLFKQGEYDKANRLFRKLIDRYGYSVEAIEAHFLLAEGLYQVGDLEGATSTIQTMVGLFPESELTGFAMVRLGQIFESRDRYEDALQIYRTILKTSPYRSVASQAESKLRHMEP